MNQSVRSICRSHRGTLFGTLATLLFLPVFSNALSTDRICNAFDTSEDIVIRINGGATSASWSISNEYEETGLYGTEPVVNGVMRIPAYFLAPNYCSITISNSSDNGTLQLMLVPGVLRYSDHLVSPVSQHQRPTPSSQFNEQAYFLLQMGFSMSNFGDIQYRTTDTNWLNFQRAMNAQGLYAMAKEGWATTWPLQLSQVQTWGNWLLNNQIDKLVVVLGNEPADAGFWTAGPQAFYDYVNLVSSGLKPLFPEGIISAPDEYVDPYHANTFYDAFYRQCAHNLDIMAIHYPSIGVESGAPEGDVSDWARYMMEKGVSKIMTDGEIHVGAGGGLYANGVTYWHANRLLSSWPTLETAFVGSYVRGCVRLDIFNPSYLGQPLWEGRVNPYRLPQSDRPIACRMLSDWLSGSFPLGRLDVGDNHPTYSTSVVRTELWATKRGSKVGVWMWTNESSQFTRVEFVTAPGTALEVVDDQGHISKAVADSAGIFRKRACPRPYFVYGFPNIPRAYQANYGNQTPQLNFTPITEAVVGGKYFGHAEGYDAEDDPYYWNRQIARFSLTTAPAGMRIGNYSGRIEWTPTAAQVGDHTVTVRYQDPQNASATQTFTVTVRPAGQNVAPIIVSNPPRIAPINRQYFYAPRAFDANGDAVTFALVSGPAGMAFVGSTLTWTPTASMGTMVTIRADDGRGGTAIQTYDLASGIVASRQRGGWPNRPANLTAVPGAGNAVVLTWQHVSDNSKGDRNEKGFVVERSSVAPGPGSQNAWATGRYPYIKPFEMIHVTEAGVHTWTDTPPAPGTYWYRVKAVNHAGDWEGYTNVSTIAVTGGGTNNPPAAPTDLRVNGLENPVGILTPNPVLSWRFNDPDPGNIQASYRILVSSTIADINASIGRMWDTGTVGGSSSHTVYSGSSLQQGVTYYWKVMTWDAFAASSPWSSAASFSMGTLPVYNSSPTVSIVSPVTGSTFTTGSDITIAATASDSDGSVVMVRFYSGTTLLGTDSTSPYSYTWVNVAAGSYALTAQAQDNEGAVRTSAVVNITVSTPNQPPVVSLTSPVNNSTYTAPATIQLTATATDSDGSIANVRFYRGSTLLNTDSASPYEYTWTNVSSGTYQLRAVAQDNQGATSTSTIITVTVLSSSTPAVWYTLTATANPANGGTVTPASGTYLAGSQIQVTATPNANYTFATWSGDVTGTNPTVTITMDSDKSITANFTYVPPMNQPPVVNITAPSPGARYSAPASIAVSATASDSDGSIVSVGFYYTTTMGPNPGVVFLGSATAAPYQYTWANVGAGEYGIIARAKDDLDAVTSASVYVIVDPAAQPPQPELTPGEVRIVGGLDGYINATANPNVTIRFRRTTAGVVTVRIYDLRGRLVLEKAKDGVAGIDDDIAWNADDLPAGVYIVRVKGGGMNTSKRAVILQ
jgi:hypothetical protein